MKLIIIIGLLSIFFMANAQELPVYNEYHLNKSLINPAIVGSEPCTWIKGTDRHQWIGIKDAPTIQTLSFETSLYNHKAVRETDKKIHGIGAYVYHDRNGAYRTLGGQISYSYHIYISKPHEVKMGLGLAFRVFQATLDESKLHGDFDPIISGTINNSIQPDIASGVFIYNQKFYTGASFTQILSSPLAALNNTQTRQHFFILGGFITGTSKDRVRLLPSAVLKFNSTFDKQVDLNIKILFNDIWWTGLSFRHNFNNLPGRPVAILPMAGINFGEFSLCYAMELTPSRILTTNYGTHEITLSYHFCRDGFRCPVYK